MFRFKKDHIDDLAQLPFVDLGSMVGDEMNYMSTKLSPICNLPFKIVLYTLV